MKLAALAALFGVLASTSTAHASKGSVEDCFTHVNGQRISSSSLGFGCSHARPAAQAANHCAKACFAYPANEPCQGFNFQQSSNGCLLFTGGSCKIESANFTPSESSGSSSTVGYIRKNTPECKGVKDEANEAGAKNKGFFKDHRANGAPPAANAPPQAGGRANPENQAVALSEKQLQRIMEAAAKDSDPESGKLLRQMAENLVESTGAVTFSDIIGLHDVKAALTTAAVFPILNPQLFSGARARSKGVLLFGPPGNGKTYIAKALANQVNLALQQTEKAYVENMKLPEEKRDPNLKQPGATQCTFLSITASAIGSKWLGESEKLMASMFKLARLLSPAIIFIDEVDSLLSQRKGGGGSDTSNKVVNQFLTSLDGVGSGDEQIVVLAATNRPFDLDSAALRRMPGKFYVPLPEKAARKDIMVKLLEKHPAPKDISDRHLDKLADMTDKYSAADLTNVMKLAAKAPLRELSEGKSKEELERMELEHLRPLNGRDIANALKTVRASANEQVIQRLEEWNLSHGNAANVGRAVVNPDDAAMDAQTMVAAGRELDVLVRNEAADLQQLLQEDPEYRGLLVA